MTDLLKKTTLTLFVVIGLFNFAQAQCTTGNCFDGVGTYVFENGDQYNGQWKKGLQLGYGVYEFANGDWYKGSWKDGLMDGRGTYRFANGDKYIGEWKTGKMNGRGHFYWELAGDLMTNAVYEGFFKDGVPKNIEVKPAGVPAAVPKNK